MHVQSDSYSTLNQQGNTSFQKDVVQRVEQYFKQNGIHKKANRAFYIKGGVSFLLTCISYISIFLVPPTPGNIILCYCALGFFSAITVFNLGHDAMHGAISTNPRVNNFFGFFWNMVGMSSYLWKIRHNYAHHPFTNVPGTDTDIIQGALIRLDPLNPWRKFHRFQHIYGPILMLLVSLDKAFSRDFLILKETQFGNKTIKHSTSQIIRIILLKVFYVGYAILIPIYFLEINPWLIVSSFICYHLVAGLYITMVLVPVHMQPETHFIRPEHQHQVSATWFDHMMEITVDFSINTPWMSLFTGGLNYHVVHHYFPSICHIHYGPLTHIIKETAAEHGKVYKHKNWLQLVVDCDRYLYDLGRGDRDGKYILAAQ